MNGTTLANGHVTRRSSRDHVTSSPDHVTSSPHHLMTSSPSSSNPGPSTYEYNQNFGVKTLLDSYEYGMHGKVFRYEHHEGMRVSAYVSYGGLLMKLTSHQAVLRQIRLDERLYCLIRKYGAGDGD